MERQYTAACIKGHVQDMSRHEMLSLFGSAIVAAIDSGELIDPPIMSLTECYECSAGQGKGASNADQDNA